MYYILKLFLNTHNDEKTSKKNLDLDTKNLFKIQGSAAEPQWFYGSILRTGSLLSATM